MPAVFTFTTVYFYFLEESGDLDVSDHVDLSSLHYVFLPRINKRLHIFETSWNGKNWEDYGIDCDGPQPDCFQDEGAVIIPDVPSLLSESDFQDLSTVVSPLQDDDSYGINVYSNACQFVRERISSQ